MESLSNQNTRLSNQPTEGAGAAPPGEREVLLAQLFEEVRLHQNAQDRFDDVACAKLGINRSDGRCLDIIDRHGRLTAGELALESGLSSGAITTLLDRMERIGYVRRVRDTEDRRRVLVELTDLARARSGAIWGPIARDAAALVEPYTDAELRTILDFVRRARALLDEHIERVRALPPWPS